MTTIEEDPTPTQKIWQPVADRTAEHIHLLSELYFAVLNGKESLALEISKQITKLEEASQQDHAAARAHVVKRAYYKVLRSRGATTAP